MFPYYFKYKFVPFDRRLLDGALLGEGHAKIWLCEMQDIPELSNFYARVWLSQLFSEGFRGRY